MTTVIKAGSCGTIVRSFTPVQHRLDDQPVAPLVSATDLALARATEEIARLRDAAGKARESTQKAVDDAREAGYRQGLEEARDDANQRLAVLQEALGKAHALWDGRLAEWDVLAVMLARSALASLFGDGADLTDLVTRTIGERIQRLRGDSVTTIRVSKRDFPDVADLETLRSKAGTGVIEISFDPALSAGECRFDLQLGHIDLGIASQWRELSGFLDDMIAEEGVA